MLSETARRFVSLVDIELPILNAPMHDVVSPEMVAAVSNAGGLGVVPASYRSPAEIESFIEEVRRLTDKPFAVNLGLAATEGKDTPEKALFAEALADLRESLGLKRMSDGYRYPDFNEQFECVLALRPNALTTFFGGLREHQAQALQSHKIVSIGCATTLREAKVLRSAEVDAIILQGAEAAGPRLAFEDSDDALVGLCALVPSVSRALDIPVIAAGAVMDDAALAGVMAMGAAGAVLGTALLASQESLASSLWKDRVQMLNATHTTLTRVFDARLTRVLRNGIVDAIEQSELTLPGFPDTWAVMQPIVQEAARQGREDLMMMPAGQGVGRARKVPCAQIIDEITRQIKNEGEMSAK